MYLFYFKAEHVYATVRTVFICRLFISLSLRARSCALFLHTERHYLKSFTDHLSSQPKPRGTNVGKSYWVLHHDESDARRLFSLRYCGELRTSLCPSLCYELHREVFSDRSLSSEKHIKIREMPTCC